MGQLQAVLRRIDRFQQSHTWTALPYGVVKKFGDDDAGNLAALIAYYAFFSIVPLLLVFFTLAGFVLPPHLKAEVVRGVKKLLPLPGISDTGLKGSGLGLTVGLVGTLYGGLGVAKAAQNAMNRVWEVPKAKWPNFVSSTVRSLEVLAIVGAGFIGTTVLSGLGSGKGTLGVGLRIVVFALSLIVNVGLFLLAFKLLTAAPVGFRQHLPGAIAAGVAWQILQVVGGLYIAHVKSGASAYGTFAIIIALLAWIYLQAQMTLFAVELNTVLDHHLWPRSIVQPPLTEGDKQAYEEYAEVQQFRPEESVDVEFLDQPEKAEKQTT
jgi:membrane protein